MYIYIHFRYNQTYNIANATLVSMYSHKSLRAFADHLT